MPSQQCNIEDQGFQMVSNYHLNLDLLVHMQKELAINIIDGEWFMFFGDQCMFCYKSRVYAVSHGARVDHGCRLNRVR